MTREVLSALTSRDENRESGIEDSGFAPPGAEEAKPESPQPRHWRGGRSSPAREWQSRQGEQSGFAPPGAAGTET